MGEKHICEQSSGEETVHKWSFLPIFALCSKLYPRNFNYMSTVKCLESLKLGQKSSFLDRHRKRAPCNECIISENSKLHSCSSTFIFSHSVSLLKFLFFSGKESHTIHIEIPYISGSLFAFSTKVHHSPNICINAYVICSVQQKRQSGGKKASTMGYQIRDKNICPQHSGFSLYYFHTTTGHGFHICGYLTRPGLVFSL